MLLLPAAIGTFLLVNLLCAFLALRRGVRRRRLVFWRQNGEAGQTGCR